MRKRMLTFIMSSVFALSMMCVPSAEAKRIQREYGDMIVTVIDEETDELFDLDCGFSILPCDESWNTSESNPFTVKNALKEASYVVVSDCAVREYDGYKYSIDYKTTYSQFFYDKSEEPYNITIYMKKEPIKQNDNCGTVNITVIDEETNELFTEHSLFSIPALSVNWDAALCNPLTLKNVPLNTAGSIVNDTYYMRDDDYYYAIDYAKDSSAFLWQVKEKVNDLTVYVHKLPREDKVEYGDIKVTVIDEETNELFSDPEGKNVVFNAYSSSMIMPSDPFFGGCVSLDEWNVNENNPFVIEDAILNNYISIVYHWAHSYVENRNYCYIIDEEKSQTPFCFTSPEQNEITLYMKKVYSGDSVKNDQPSETDTSVINADNDYTFEDIRSMTVEEIQALFEMKGIKKSHVHTTNNTQNNFLMDPMPYLSDNIPEDVMAVLKDMSDSNEIIYWFDEEKVKKSLGLPDELFEITVKVSMPIGIDDTPVQKYCECIIQPKTEDLQTRRELLSAAMNYVQLNPDYRDVGLFFQPGGEESNSISTTTITSSTTTTVSTTTTKQTSIKEPIIDQMTTTNTLEPTLKGDVNCDNEVDMADAVMIMQALANPNKYGIEGTAEHHLTEQGKLNGDMNGDGLTVGDAQAIQKKLLGLKK